MKRDRVKMLRVLPVRCDEQTFTIQSRTLQAVSLFLNIVIQIIAMVACMEMFVQGYNAALWLVAFVFLVMAMNMWIIAE